MILRMFFFIIIIDKLLFLIDCCIHFFIIRAGIDLKAPFVNLNVNSENWRNAGLHTIG